MLRFLHSSDLHIGVEGYSRPATAADLEALPPSFAPGVDRRAAYLGLPTRLLDALRAFDELVDAAISEQVDLVLFCGDAYRSRDPSQTHQREFARRIARL
ncbi:MAG: metallophosphoesterase, partial [Chloroflexi bacterium]|nr:metallophosphoesterase [Chloroflexota bacterium]